MVVTHDISQMLGWVGISPVETGYNDFQSALGGGTGDSAMVDGQYYEVAVRLGC
jgi:hypothetical protein